MAVIQERHKYECGQVALRCVHTFSDSSTLAITLSLPKVTPEIISHIFEFSCAICYMFSALDIIITPLPPADLMPFVPLAVFFNCARATLGSATARVGGAPRDTHWRDRSSQDLKFAEAF